MFDVVRQVRIESPMVPESLPSWQDGPLVLEGNVPVNVYVQIDLASQKVGLASSLTGPYYTDGISWGCSGYALMITFVFMDSAITEVTPVTPSCWFSDTFPLDGTNGQGCCVPPIPGEYHFSVNYNSPSPTNGNPGKGKLDPIIVVTPL